MRGAARPGFTAPSGPGTLSLLPTTLTDDRQKERAEHARVAERLAIQGFVADPYSPWPGGTHEHTRGCCASTGPRARIGRAPPSASCTPVLIG